MKEGSTLEDKTMELTNRFSAALPGSSKSEMFTICHRWSRQFTEIEKRIDFNCVQLGIIMRK